MKRYSFVFSLLFLAACSHKPTVTPPTSGVEPTPNNPPTAEQPVKPAEPVQGPVPSERPHVALVLGGAGVASFATVGLLKRLFEEGIVVDYIVTTGWPTLFALGYGFLKSVHDLEWFAMRLNEKDFFKAGLFSKDNQSQENLSALIDNTFKQRDLSETTVPVFIAAGNTEANDSVLYEKGDWKEPLLKTMSVPGMYRPYPNEGSNSWISSLQGMDVSRAMQKGGKNVIAVQMYEDYFESVKKGGEANDRVFRQLYLTQLKKSLKDETKLATVTVDIALKKSPSDFAARRIAILAGYKEGARIAKALRRQ